MKTIQPKSNVKPRKKQAAKTPAASPKREKKARPAAVRGSARPITGTRAIPIAAGKKVSPQRKTANRPSRKKPKATGQRLAKQPARRPEETKPKLPEAPALPKSAASPSSLDLSLMRLAELNSLKIEEFYDRKLNAIEKVLGIVVNPQEGLKSIQEERRRLADELGSLRRELSQSPLESVPEAEENSDPDKAVRDKIDFCRFLIEDLLDERAAVYQRSIDQSFQSQQPSPVPVALPKPVEREAFVTRRENSPSPVPATVAIAPPVVPSQPTSVSSSVPAPPAPGSGNHPRNDQRNDRRNDRHNNRRNEGRNDRRNDRPNDRGQRPHQQPAPPNSHQQQKPKKRKPISNIAPPIVVPPYVRRGLGAPRVQTQPQPPQTQTLRQQMPQRHTSRHPRRRGKPGATRP